MHKPTFLLVALVLLLGLAACATFRGMGEDFENLGKGIKSTVSK
jgi:predicted small secreted protein